MAAFAPRKWPPKWPRKWPRRWRRKWPQTYVAILATEAASQMSAVLVESDDRPVTSRRATRYEEPVRSGFGVTAGLARNKDF